MAPQSNSASGGTPKRLSRTPSVKSDAPPHSDTPPTTAPTSITPRITFAKALYDFAANEQDELYLEEEDVVRVLNVAPRGGWLYGSNHGVWGWFPENYVRMLTDEEAIAEGVMEASELEAGSSGGGTGSVEVESNAAEEESPGAGRTRSWYTKYKKMPRYEKRLSSNNSRADAADDDARRVSATVGAKSDSTATLSMDAPTTGDREVTIGEMRTLDGNRTSSMGSLGSLQLERTASRSRPTSLLRSKDRESRSASDLLGSSSKSSNTVISPKQVSIVGGAALQRPRWVDVMGGPEAVAKLGLSKKEIQRQEVIHEIYTTEKDYVEDLEIIIEVYIKQLQKNKLIRTKDMSVIFCNVEQLLPVNQELLKWLEDRVNENPVVERVGDIFSNVSDYLKMYTMYCSCHPYALMKLQAVRQSKSVAKFLDELIKNTDEDHVDYAALVAAFYKIETVVTIVNEGGRQAEEVRRMLELQNRFAGVKYETHTTTRRSTVSTPT
ncbi:Myosin 10A, isoform D [Borealophlyctis nickersoniae]|nr:Myosin 10A, isoform D [Borealophlyctis nickersoniae]